MDSNLIIKRFGSMDVRIIDQNGDPWFVAKDACDVLGIENTGNAISRLNPDEKSYIQRTDVGMSPGRPMFIINEPGLYHLISRSNKPEAEKFQHWVNHEVLPSIRKTGGYIMGEENMSEEEMILNGYEMLMRKVKLQREKIAEQQKQIEEMAPKAEYADSALSRKGGVSLRQGWKSLGLQPNKMNAICREKKFFYPDERGSNENCPAQWLVNRGFFFTYPSYWNESTQRWHYQTLITEAGKNYMRGVAIKWGFSPR